MKLKTTLYKEQLKKWPEKGQHIMAQYDEEKVIVYQSYRPAIGNFAMNNQYFGGPFKYTRMTWIKPNFLWMMYRNGWGTKEGQEMVLAIHLKRRAIQLGIRNQEIIQYATEDILEIEDISNFVKEQHQHVLNKQLHLLMIPDEKPYISANAEVNKKLKLATHEL